MTLPIKSDPDSEREVKTDLRTASVKSHLVPHASSLRWAQKKLKGLRRYVFLAAIWNKWSPAKRESLRVLLERIEELLTANK